MKTKLGLQAPHKVTMTGLYLTEFSKLIWNMQRVLEDFGWLGLSHGEMNRCPAKGKALSHANAYNFACLQHQLANQPHILLCSTYNLIYHVNV